MRDVKHYMVDQELTLSGVARLAGLSDSGIRVFWNCARQGKSNSLRAVVAIAHACDLALDKYVVSNEVSYEESA